MDNFKKFKTCMKISKPNMWLFISMILLNIAVYLSWLYFATPSANVITAMTISDFDAAVYWLIICFLLVLAQRIILTLVHQLYFFQLKYMWKRLHGKIYDKVLNASASGYGRTSKEQIINTIYNNVGTLDEFTYYFAETFSYFIQAVISIVLLIIKNWLIGIIIVGSAVIIYILNDLITKKIGLANKKYYEYEDRALETVADNYNNHTLTKDMGFQGDIDKKYNRSLTLAQDTQVQIGKYYEYREVWMVLLSKFIVFAISLYMIFLIKADIFTITLYLVLTSYISQALDKTTSAQTMLEYINNAYVASLRVKTILDMNQEDLKEFGNNKTNDITGEVIFTNVSYSSNTDTKIGKINTTTIKIKRNSITVISGLTGSGKRALYYMLNRTIRPNTGTITMGGINIYDFDREIYIHNFATAESKPYFYNQSILKNLQVTGASNKQIYEICQQLNLHNKIIKLENSYQTNFENAKFSGYEKYLLGLARAMCTNAEVIAIYETPSAISSEQLKELKNIIKDISKVYTLIIFTSSDILNDVGNNNYIVENGNVIKNV